MEFRIVECSMGNGKLILVRGPRGLTGCRGGGDLRDIGE